MLQYLQKLFSKNKWLESTEYHSNARRLLGNINEMVIILNGIYEAQFLLDICKHDIQSLYLLGCMLRPYDCMSISYFMLIGPITRLCLVHCGIGDREAEMLARWKDFKSSLKVLDLSTNHITHKGMESVATIIKSSINLTRFAVAKNPLDDDDIQLFSMLTLEHLIQLNISKIEMNEVGTCALGQYFKFDKSLQSLDISNNNIKDI